MRYLSILILIFVFECGLAQSSKVKVKQPAPSYFIDSIRIENAVFTQLKFDVHKIIAINVVKEKSDSIKYPGGKVYIKIKPDQKLNLKTFSDFQRQKSLPQAILIIFLYDGRVVSDTTGFKVDSAYIQSIQVVTTKELKYYHAAQPTLSFLNVIPRVHEIHVVPGAIYIR